MRIKDENFNVFNNIRKSNLSTESLIKKIFKKFNKKYNIMPKRYNATVVDNIIFNEKSHIVSIFKDLLINYDFNDFLKRFYTKKESSIRLPKYFEYYNLYSKIFPNYTSIPEGKYFYINIQKKQRMIDLQENMENEKSKEKKMKKPKKKEQEINVFNTSMINSILNRTNKEEMEMLFDINLENIPEDENKFLKKINKLIDNINSYEIKEDFFIDYNYESKNDKKNNKNEIISPLMNININYINFNKFNDVKTNSVSFHNQNNKNNNSLLYKIFNVPLQNPKQNLKNPVNVNNKNAIKDAGAFLIKIDQEKKKIKNATNYLKNINNGKLSVSKNVVSSLGKNNSSNNLNINQRNKNKTIVYEYKKKSKSKELLNNLKIDKSNMSLKNIFSYRTSFGYLSPNNNNNNIELPQTFPLSSRNKNHYIERNNANLYLTNNKYFTKRQYQSPSNNNKSTISQKDNNLYVLINNSRNKVILNNTRQLIPETSNKFVNIRDSITPIATKFKLKQKKKLKNNSILNNKFFDKKKLWNLENNNNNTILKENMLNNNFVNDENITNKNKNINKNNSIFINKSNSIKSTNMYQNNSSRNLNSHQIDKRINHKRDITGMYVKDFIRAFNNSRKLRSNFLSQRDKDQ